jgi:hypothetical protein
MGRETYPGARQLLITAGRGGSHGSRVRLWKRELQKLADETRLEISVCHFPQWNDHSWDRSLALWIGLSEHVRPGSPIDGS